MVQERHNSVYVAQVYKHGNKGRHSYVVGIFDNRQDAIDAIEREEKYRNGKYAGIVHKMPFGINVFERNVESVKSKHFRRLNE